MSKEKGVRITVKNGTPVSIQLQTEVYQNEEKQEHFFDVTGQLVKIGTTLYLRYKETPEEEGAADIPVTIKIEADGTVQLIRAAEKRTRLKFNYQQENYSHYRTPYGMMEIRTFTNNLRVSLKEQPTAGSVSIDYDLYAGKEKLGVYHLRLHFTA